MSAQHTPGPWVYSGQGTVSSRVGDVCCDVENEADAVLIAAALDMADVLKESLEMHDNVRDKKRTYTEQEWANHFERRRAALAKAGG